MQIADGLQRECGEKPFSNSLSSPSTLGYLYQTEYSVKLKEAADKLVDKFQIIGMNLINFKKFKTEA